MRLDLIERIHRNTIIDKTTKCWLYQGAKDNDGYCTTYMDGKSYSLGRVSIYIYLKLDINDSWEVCHICNNKHCWNPLHIYAGTHQDNMNDRFRKGGHYKRKQALCKRGHEYTGYREGRNGKLVRFCQQCNYITSHRSRFPNIK